MLRLKELDIVESRAALREIPEGKVLINTINAHSFNVAQKDVLFAEALANGDYLIPDGASIIKAINDANPDLLWIGMTAPKQEKWTYSHWKELNIHCHVGTIGAVFDFYAGTAQRAPRWWQEHSLEWLYRLIKEPKRMWRRYVIGNPLFLWNIGKEK